MKQKKQDKPVQNNEPVIVLNSSEFKKMKKAKDKFKKYYYMRFDPEEMILRDHLAWDRTAIANERTLLSYIRSSLMFFVTGLTLLKIISQGYLVWIGAALIPVSLVFGIVGVSRYLTLRYRLLHVYKPLMHED